MKKFSWILALILALSIGFVGCPAGDDGDDKSPPPPPPASGIVFGTGAGQTQVFEKDTPTGTITYDNGAYTYEYGTGSGSTYGSALVRFMVDLGEDSLGKYSAVRFKWSATGYNDSDSVASNKNLFLLATIDEDAIKQPGKTTAGYLTDAEIKEIVISTEAFVDTPGANLYADFSDVPKVGGDVEQTVILPIVLGQHLAGPVWFSIYVHAVKDSYTVRSFELLEGEPQAASVTPPTTNPSLDRPVPPPPPGAKPVYFEAVLSEATCKDQGTTDGGLNNHVPDVVNNAGGGIDVTFTQNGERLNIGFSNEQINAIKNRNKGTIKVTIDFEITGPDDGSGGIDTTGDSFRYHIGDPSQGGGWNLTNGSNNVVADYSPLDNIKEVTLVVGANGANLDCEPTHLMLQHRNGNEITVWIKSVVIGEIAPEAEITFASGDVEGHNTTVVVESDGSGFTATNTAGYESAYVYFQVTFETGYILSDYSKIALSLLSTNTQWKPIRVAAFSTEPDGDTLASDDDNIIGSVESGNPIGASGTTHNIVVPIIVVPSDVDKNEVYIAICIHAESGADYKITGITFKN